jgi:hypothetical protein
MWPKGVTARAARSIANGTVRWYHAGVTWRARQRGGRGVRDGERFWWIQLPGGVVICLAGVVAPFIVLNLVPWGDPFISGSGYALFFGIMALFTAVCVGCGLWLALASFPARRRHWARIAAFNGDEAAMPSASIRPNPVLAPDVEAQPLDLLWRAGGSVRFLRAPLMVLQILIALPSIGVAVFVFVVPLFEPSQPSPYTPFGQPPQPMGPLEIALRLAAAGVIVAAVISGGIFCARALPTLFGRAYGVTATADGIEERTALGGRKRMAWGEMRLLEVTSKVGRSFSLYAQGKRIDWTEHLVRLGSDTTPAGISASEMAQRQEELLALIAARAGLTPRTLSPKLMSTKLAPTLMAVRRTLIAGMLVLAVIAAGLGAVEEFFPLTPYGWMNWASIASLGLLALGCVAGAIRSAMPVPQPDRELAGPPVVGAPSLEALQAGYSYNWRAPALRRVVIPAAGLCLAVNLLPGGWGLAQFGVVLLRTFQPSPLANTPFPSVGQFMLGLVLAGVGFGGLASAYTGATTTAIQVRADAYALSVGRGRTQRRIPWSSMEDISWGTGPGGQASYYVKSSPPIVLITWPTGPRAMDTVPPHDGALSLGPDELAALVAAKLGQPIRVRE